jgi:hypothetical protein
VNEKQELAGALKRAKEIYRGDGQMLASEAVARAYGYLESAVEQYVGYEQDQGEGGNWKGTGLDTDDR